MDYLMVATLVAYIAWMVWLTLNPPYRGRHRFPDDPNRFNYKRHYMYWCPEEKS